jgi:predicted lipoprotein
MKTARLSVVCAALLGVAGIGCSNPGAPDTRRELLSSWSTALIVPSYEDFALKTGELRSSIDALCAAPSSDALEASKTAWLAAQDSLKRAEVFAFGPFSRPEFRIGPQLDSWPARVDDVEDVLTSEMPIDPASLASFGVWRKGLPVVEYLLYPPVGDAVELARSPRRCEYLQSLGTEVDSRANEIHMAWSPEGGNFAEQLSGAGRTSTAFESLVAAFSEIVNRMGFTVENVRTNKLGRPLGEDAGGTPAPEYVESRFSARSIDNIHHNLDGIETLYFGDDARSIPGLRRYVTERGADYDAQVTAALNASHQSLDAIGAPLSEAVVSAPDRVREASTRLGELQALIQVDLIGALGLSLNFNDNDGD